MKDDDREHDSEVRVHVIRLDALAQGLTTGLLCGLGVLVASTWLLLKGGPVIGPNLALLGQFFYGFEMSFVGSLIGFGWAFVYGGIAGYAVSRLYNWSAGRR